MLPNSELRTLNFELRAQRGFTLIELLVVMAIIAVLAGITIGVHRVMHRNAIEGAMKSQIKKLEAAIEAFRADTGEYPLDTTGAVPMVPFAVTDDGLNTPTGRLLQPTTPYPARVPLVLPPPAGSPWRNTVALANLLAPTAAGSKQYITFGERERRDIGGGVMVIVDALGNPLGYNPLNLNPADTPIGNPATFDLWALGVDGESGYNVDPVNRAWTFLPVNDDIGNWQQ